MAVKVNLRSEIDRSDLIVRVGGFLNPHPEDLTLIGWCSTVWADQGRGGEEVPQEQVPSPSSPTRIRFVYLCRI